MPGGLFCFALCCFRHHLGDKTPGEAALAAALDVEKPNDGKNDRANKVDQKIFHGVYDPHIQVSAQAQGILPLLGDHDHICDALDEYRV